MDDTGVDRPGHARFRGLAEVALITDKRAGRAGPGRAQRPARRGVRHGLRRRARAALHAGQCRHRERRPAGDFRHRRRLSRRAAGRGGRPTSSATPPTVRRITCTPAAGVDRQQQVLVLSRRRRFPSIRPRPKTATRRASGEGRKPGRLADAHRLASAARPQEILLPVQAAYIAPHAAGRARAESAAADRLGAGAAARFRRAGAALSGCIHQPRKSACRHGCWAWRWTSRTAPVRPARAGLFDDHVRRHFCTGAYRCSACATDAPCGRHPAASCS